MRPSTGTAPLCLKVMTTSFPTRLVQCLPPSADIIHFMGPESSRRETLPATLPSHPSSLSASQKMTEREKNHLRRDERSHVSSLPKLPVHLITAAAASSRDSHLKEKRKRENLNVVVASGEEGVINNGNPASFFSSFFFKFSVVSPQPEGVGVHSRDITQVAFTASPPSASASD